MQSTRPTKLSSTIERAFDFTRIEKGALQGPDPGTAGSTDDGALKIQDIDGGIVVIGNTLFGESDPPGNVRVSAQTSHSGRSCDRLILTLLFFNFVTRSYDLIGTELVGGSEQASHYYTSLGVVDPHIGARGEVRAKLIVSPGDFPPTGEKYTLAIHSVTLHLGDGHQVDGATEAVVRTLRVNEKTKGA